jgi:3-oxoadipate enol-lactonase
MQEFAAPLGGITLHYKRAGSGPALVLLHAGIADSRMWMPQIDFFSQHYDVIAPDIRGFGQSLPVDGPFTFHEDITALLDHLQIKKAAVVGASFGGAIALNLALSHPERVTALALVCAAIAGFDWHGETPEIAEKIDAACEQDNVDLANELEIERWVVGEGRTRADVDRKIIDLVLHMNRIALMMPELGEEIEPKPDAINRLNEIAVPTLVIGADHDDPISRARSEILSSQIPKAKTILMGDAGHLPSLEQSAEFNSVLSAFLKDTPAQ